MNKILNIFGPLFFSVTFSLLVMAGIARQPKIKFSEVALGAQNTSRFAVRDGTLIHIQKRKDFPELISGVKSRNLGNTILWLGNSQLHAINNAHVNDETAVAKVHDFLLGEFDTVATSYPNANLQEHLVTLAYLHNKLNNIKVLIVPLVFDDLRETGIRDDIQPLLENPSVAEQLKTLQCCENLVRGVFSDLDPHSSGVVKQEIETRETLQDKTEKFLDQILERNSIIWASREKARGLFFLQLYRLRNTVFAITPQTKRAVIKPRYKANIEAFKGILELANRDAIQVVSYIAPLRTDVKPPYDLAAYTSFKNEVRILCSQFPNVSFFDFERIVPAEYWGLKNTTSLNTAQEIDFMHFMEPGHQKLANAIVEVFRSMNLENVR